MGWDKCKNGYKGRLAVSEVQVISDRIQQSYYIAAQKRHPKAEEELPQKIYNDLRYIA